MVVVGTPEMLLLAVTAELISQVSNTWRTLLERLLNTPLTAAAVSRIEFYSRQFRTMPSEGIFSVNLKGLSCR